MSWWLLILASGTLGFTSGVDVFAGLVLGKVDVLPGYGAGTTPIDASPSDSGADSRSVS